MVSQRQGKTLLAAAAVVLAGAAAPAVADIGLGAAITDGAFGTGTTVIVPIRTPTLLIEPQLQYADDKFLGTTTKTTAPGVGVFLRKEVGPLFEAYYGGILAYNQTKTTGGGPDTKSTAFSIIPTIGVQHYFSKQFSIGLDVGLNYTDGTTKVSGGADQDIRTFDTVTRILLRGYIW